MHVLPLKANHITCFFLSEKQQIKQASSWIVVTISFQISYTITSKSSIIAYLHNILRSHARPNTLISIISVALLVPVTIKQFLMFLSFNEFFTIHLPLLYYTGRLVTRSNSCRHQILTKVMPTYFRQIIRSIFLLKLDFKSF